MLPSSLYQCTTGNMAACDQGHRSGGGGGGGGGCADTSYQGPIWCGGGLVVGVGVILFKDHKKMLTTNVE